MPLNLNSLRDGPRLRAAPEEIDPQAATYEEVVSSGLGQMGKGLRSAMHSSNASNDRTRGLKAEAAGDMETAEEAYASAALNDSRAAISKPRVQSMRDIRGGGDVVDYLAAGVGQLPESLVPVIAGGLAGRFIGTAAARRFMPTIMRSNLPSASAYAGAAIPAYNMESEESIGQLAQDPQARARHTPNELINMGRGKAVVNAALDVAVPGHVINKMFGGAVRGSAKKAALGTVVGESATETSQQIVGDAVVSNARTGNVELDPWSLADAAALGAMGGGALAIPSAAATGVANMYGASRDAAAPFARRAMDGTREAVVNGAERLRTAANGTTVPDMPNAEDVGVAVGSAASAAKAKAEDLAGWLKNRAIQGGDDDLDSITAPQRKAPDGMDPIAWMQNDDATRNDKAVKLAKAYLADPATPAYMQEAARKILSTPLAPTSWAEFGNTARDYEVKNKWTTNADYVVTGFENLGIKIGKAASDLKAGYETGFKDISRRFNAQQPGPAEDANPLDNLIIKLLMKRARVSGIDAGVAAQLSRIVPAMMKHISNGYKDKSGNVTVPEGLEELFAEVPGLLQEVQTLMYQERQVAEATQPPEVKKIINGRAKAKAGALDIIKNNLRGVAADEYSLTEEKYPEILERVRRMVLGLDPYDEQALTIMFGDNAQHVIETVNNSIPSQQYEKQRDEVQRTESDDAFSVGGSIGDDVENVKRDFGGMTNEFDPNIVGDDRGTKLIGPFNVDEDGPRAGHAKYMDEAKAKGLNAEDIGVVDQLREDYMDDPKSFEKALTQLISDNRKLLDVTKGEGARPEIVLNQRLRLIRTTDDTVKADPINIDGDEFNNLSATFGSEANKWSMQKGDNDEYGGVENGRLWFERAGQSVDKDTGEVKRKGMTAKRFNTSAGTIIKRMRNSMKTVEQGNTGSKGAKAQREMLMQGISSMLNATDSRGDYALTGDVYFMRNGVKTQIKTKRAPSAKPGKYKHTFDNFPMDLKMFGITTGESIEADKAQMYAADVKALEAWVETNKKVIWYESSEKKQAAARSAVRPLAALKKTAALVTRVNKTLAGGKSADISRLVTELSLRNEVSLREWAIARKDAKWTSIREDQLRAAKKILDDLNEFEEKAILVTQVQEALAKANPNLEERAAISRLASDLSSSNEITGDEVPKSEATYTDARAAITADGFGLGAVMYQDDNFNPGLTEPASTNDTNISKTDQALRYKASFEEDSVDVRARKANEKYNEIIQDFEYTGLEKQPRPTKEIPPAKKQNMRYEANWVDAAPNEKLDNRALAETGKRRDAFVAAEAAKEIAAKQKNWVLDKLGKGAPAFNAAVVKLGTERVEAVRDVLQLVIADTVTAANIKARARVALARLGDNIKVEQKSKLQQLVDANKATLRDGIYYVTDPSSTKYIAATTMSDEIYINLGKIKESPDAFKNYLIDSQQKIAVLNLMGIDPVKLAESFNSTRAIATFLRDHEQSHVTNADKKTYPRNDDNSLDLMNEKALVIEARATLDALTDAQLASLGTTRAAVADMIKSGRTVSAIHVLADKLGIPWDNDAAFMQFTKDTVGKRHLDDLTATERSTLYDALTERGSPSKKEVERRSNITREMVRAEPDKLFVYGDNDNQLGLGGQAAAMRGEPNTVGVRTKAAPNMGANAFWSDATYDANVAKIDEDFARIDAHKGGIVLPSDGLGTGRAQLDKRAPRTFAYLAGKLAELDAPKPGSGVTVTDHQSSGYRARTEGIAEAGNLYRNALMAIGGFNDKIARIKDEGIARNFIREEDMLAEHARTKGMTIAERAADRVKNKSDRIAALKDKIADQQSFVDSLVADFGKDALQAARTKITARVSTGTQLGGREVNIHTVGRDIVARVNAMTSQRQIREFAAAQRSRGEALGDSKLGQTMVAEARYAESKLTQKGPVSDITVTDHQSSGYRARTKHNADSAGATVAIAINFDTAGERLTKSVAGDKYFAIPYGTPADVAGLRLAKFMRALGTTTLNIAGNGIYTLNDEKKLTQAEVNTYIHGIIAAAHKLLPITKIVSGGQTGVDIAGAVAAKALGIPAVITLPRGYVQRNELKQDQQVGKAAVEQQITDGAASLEKPAKPNSQTQSFTTEPLTAEQKAKVIADVVRRVGPQVKVEFAKIFATDAAGLAHEISGDWVENTIRISLSATNPDQIGAHESMHEFFDRISKSKDKSVAKVKNILLNAANSPAVLGQLEVLLDKHPAALAQIRTTGEHFQEERLAYAFQFWQAGLLNIGPETKTIFQKIVEFIRSVVGMLTNDMKAERLLEAFDKGKMLTEDAVVSVLENNVEYVERKRKAAAAVLSPVTSAIAKLVFPAQDRLLHSGNPSLVALSKMFKQPTGEAVPDTMFESRQRNMNHYLNYYNKITYGATEKELALAAEYLHAGRPPQGGKALEVYNGVRGLLDDMHKYMVDADVMRWELDKGGAKEADGTAKGAWVPIGKITKNYMPHAFDVSVITANPEAFIQDLLRVHEKQLNVIAVEANKEAAFNYNVPDSYASGVEQRARQNGKFKELTAEDIAVAITNRILNSFGQIELEESETQVGYQPYMRAVNKRILTWLDTDALNKYMNNNLNDVIETYIVQSVKRTEYVRTFDNGGTKLQAKIDDAYQYEKQRAMDEDNKLSPEEVEAKALEKMDSIGKVVMALEGTLGYDIDPRLRNAAGLIIAYENVRLLSMALFSQMIDPLGIMIRGGEAKYAFGAYSRGIKEVMAAYKGTKIQDHATELAEFIGTVEAAGQLATYGQQTSSMYLGKRARMINNALFKYNGMEGFNRAARVQATTAAIEFIKYHASLPDKASQAYLDELNLTPAELELDTDGNLNYTNPKVRAGINRWVNGAVLRPNAAQRPVYMSDPRYMVFGHMKQFSYTFHDVILKRVAHDATVHGNLGPLAVLATFAPIMIAADLGKALLLGANPTWAHDLGSIVDHGATRAGYLGMYQPVWDATMGTHGLMSIAGPAAEQVTNMFVDPIGEIVRDALPGANVLNIIDPTPRVAL